MCRWASADPAGLADGLNRYLYARGSPIRLMDGSGLEGEESQGATPDSSVALSALDQAYGVLRGADNRASEGIDGLFEIGTAAVDFFGDEAAQAQYIEDVEATVNALSASPELALDVASGIGQAVISELGQSYKKEWEAGRYGDIIGMAAVDALTLQYALTAYSARGAKAGQVAVGAADTAGDAVEVAADVVEAAADLGKVGGSKGTGAFSRVLPVEELASLPKAAPGSDTIVLGPFSRRVSFDLPGGQTVTGLQNTLEDILEPAASQLGGRTLSNFPGDFSKLAPEIQGANRIIFFTAEGGFGPLTKAEMNLIQGTPQLRNKTTFVQGAIK